MKRENNKQKVMLNNVMFYVVTVLMILIITFCMSQTVRGESESKKEIDFSYTDTLESEYIENIKELLKKAGLNNSGITMTKIMNEDGNLSYTVSIHHKNIEKLSDSQRRTLIDDIEQYSFLMENATFSYEI